MAGWSPGVFNQFHGNVSSLIVWMAVIATEWCVPSNIPPCGLSFFLCDGRMGYSMRNLGLEKCRGPKLLLQLFVRSFRTVSIHLRLFQFVSPTDAVRGLYLISNIMRASGFLILFGVWASNFFCFFPSLGGNKLLVFWVVSRGVGYQDEGMCLVFLYCSCFEKEFCASCFG